MKQNKWVLWRYSEKNTGDIVRVVNMAPFSIELRGGIHVDNTAEIDFSRL